MKPIQLSRQQWRKLKELLSKEYQDQPSIMLIRSKMRDVLGFTVREHRQWVPAKTEPEFSDLIVGSPGHQETFIMLDFFNESMRTMFLLKYSHIINESRDCV